MADKFRITEMKREGDQWEVKVAVPRNMLSFSSFSIKVEAEMNPPGGGVVERDIADVLKTVSKRTAYAFQVLANVAFEALDEDSAKSVKGAILHDATQSPDRT
jgi:hypothetical protein